MAGGSQEPIEGSYIRVVYRGDAKGVRSLFALLRLPDGKFLLNLAYRRPSGQWKLEGAGTITQEGESEGQALQRLVTDEAGSQILHVVPLGRMIPERGLVGTTVPIYLVDIAEPSNRINDPTVAGHVRFSSEEIDQAFLDGVWSSDERSYICDDSFTAYAMYMARLRKLI